MALKYSCFVQMPCAKTPEFGIRRILGLYAGFLFYQRLVPKLQNSAFAEFWDCTPVLALELGTLFPNSAQAEFGSFGLGRLERNGFLCAKAPLDP